MLIGINKVQKNAITTSFKKRENKNVCPHTASSFLPNNFIEANVEDTPHPFKEMKPVVWLATTAFNVQPEGA